MAFLGAGFAQDFAQVKEQDFTPVPAGEYTLQVTKTELKPTSNGGQYVAVTFDILGPAYQGRKVFANFNIVNNSAEAERIGKQQLKSLVKAGRVQEPFSDTDQLLGAVVKASVTVRPATQNYPESNNVRNFKEAEGAMPSFGDAMPQAATPPTTPSAAPSFSEAFAPPAQVPAAQVPAPNFNW